MRYVMRDGQLVPKHLAAPKHAADRAAFVISDSMDPVKHMMTGKVMDSKSQFRAATRASGCEEAGTDPAIMRAPPKFQPDMGDIVSDVKRSLQELRSR